jgi:hypothetical protein
MPLPQASLVTPTAIADISIELTDYIAGADPDEEPARQEGRYSVQVQDGDGRIMRIMTGDILEHLSSADKVWLSDFLDRMRAKATAEILP